MYTESKIWKCVVTALHQNTAVKTEVAALCLAETWSLAWEGDVDNTVR